MSAVAITMIAVKTARKGLRRPMRSLMAPSTGETAALTSTDALTAIVNQSMPTPSPRKRMAHRLIANETIAKEKIVLAKSYSAQASAARGLPLLVRPPRRRQAPAGSAPRSR